jgi:hypothetical protein
MSIKEGSIAAIPIRTPAEQLAFIVWSKLSSEPAEVDD